VRAALPFVQWKTFWIGTDILEGRESEQKSQMESTRLCGQQTFKDGPAMAGLGSLGKDLNSPRILGLGPVQRGSKFMRITASWPKTISFWVNMPQQEKRRPCQWQFCNGV
jgi:hypothetical protein